MQVVRPGPDVDEDQRPEVQDRQLVTEDRAIRRLRQEVVHQPEERRRQEERDRVVPVPPLHERVLHAGVDRIALEQPDRHDEVVEDVQHRDGDDRRDVEPERDVQVPFAAIDERHQEVDAEESEPDDRDREIDRPFELCVFLALRDAERQRDRGGDDDRLPAPEMEAAQTVAPHPRFAQPLRRVIDRGEDRVAREGEDRSVRVQRAKPAERRNVEPKAQCRHDELQGDEHADARRDGSPDECRRREQADDRIVVPVLDGFVPCFKSKSRLIGRYPSAGDAELWFQKTAHSIGFLGGQTPGWSRPAAMGFAVSVAQKAMPMPIDHNISPLRRTTACLDGTALGEHHRAANCGTVA